MIATLTTTNGNTAYYQCPDGHRHTRLIGDSFSIEEPRPTVMCPFLHDEKGVSSGAREKIARWTTRARRG